MPSASSSGPSLREVSRDAVRARITDIALRLFAECGFDQVTVEQVAAAAGMSARTFHRYFPAKEDVVIGDPTRWGEYVRDTLAARPRSEPVWESLAAAFDTLVSHQVDAIGDARGKLALRVLGSTASLRARNVEKHLAWARLLTPVVTERLTGDDAALRAEVLVQSALACFDVALTAWANTEDGTELPGLLERAFATLAPRV